MQVELHSSVLLTNLQAGQTYEVKIRSLVGPEGNIFSEWSDPVKATTYPEAPQILSVQSFTAESAQLNWSSQVNTSVDSYHLRWFDGNTLKQENFTASETSANVIELHPGRTYTLEIKTGVISPDGSTLLSIASPRQTTVIQTLLPLPPENVRIDSFTSESVTISWTDIAATEYTGFELSY